MPARRPNPTASVVCRGPNWLLVHRLPLRIDDLYYRISYPGRAAQLHREAARQRRHRVIMVGTGCLVAPFTASGLTALLTFWRSWARKPTTTMWPSDLLSGPRATSLVARSPTTTSWLA